MVVTFRVGLDAFAITKKRVRAAMHRFDLHFRPNEPSSGTRFAVVDHGKLYPPKRILGLAIGRSGNPFAGGKNTNRVFEALGFKVKRVTQMHMPSKAEEKANLRQPPPTVARLVGKLFSQRWMNLHSAIGRLDNVEYPGVYVLAYGGDDLENRRVEERNVYYVGMSSHAGVRKRLSQLIKGLEDGGHHSAAKRFFKTVACGVPYSRYRDKQTFYVATSCVPCVPNKRKRGPLDLRKMGVVSAAEQYVLARIRNKIGREPELNKK